MSEKQDIRALVTQHGDYLLHVALSKLTDREVAKDLVQDTFLSALSHSDSFKGESSLKTWLTSILNRKIIDYWRKAETKYSDPLSHFFKDDKKTGDWIDGRRPVGRIADFEKQLIQDEEHTALLDCIEGLPEKWRMIIRSKYFLEKKMDEISREFDITSFNMWVIIHRSKLVLRECVEQKLM